jgi:1,2-phenylacetyl-CoA epoxidase PaaB subunit
MEKVKGSKTYQYWMASWREGDKVRNVHLGSCRKVDRETALQKARKVKREALGIRP